MIATAKATMRAVRPPTKRAKAARTRRGDWIQTYTGKRFWPLDPRAEEVDILDIAHALSNLCRFGGHCREFYSVAEHSVRGSYLVPEPDALWFLLHDSPEAYMVDIPRPIKHSPGLELVREIEARIMAVISNAFNLPWPEPESVKRADLVMLRTEQRDLMGDPPADWESAVRDAIPLANKIIPVSPKRAKEMFLARFNFLMEKT